MTDQPNIFRTIVWIKEKDKMVEVVRTIKEQWFCHPCDDYFYIGRRGQCPRCEEDLNIEFCRLEETHESRI